MPTDTPSSSTPLTRNCLPGRVVTTGGTSSTKGTASRLTRAPDTAVGALKGNRLRATPTHADARLHPHRATRGHRDHCHPCRHSLSRLRAGAEQGAAGRLSLEY